MRARKGVELSHVFLFLSLLHLLFFLILGLFPQLFADNSISGNTFIEPLIPYAAGEINLDEAFQKPTWQLESHFLGTDNLGRDILAGIIYGCQTSLFVSFPAMIIAAIIGISFGLLGGYFGNDTVKTSYLSLLIYSVAILLGVFYAFYLNQYSIKEALEKGVFAFLFQVLISCFIIAAFLGLSHLFLLFAGKWKSSIANFHFPIDELILKLTELFSAVPRFILILALAAFVRPSLLILVLIIGFTSWPGMARLVRAEVLKVKRLQYIEASKSLGLTNRSILTKHILPNALPAGVVAFTFGLANLLALEATLSFLGIGLPPDIISWGKIIAGVRHNLSAWWLVVFPGLYLALTVLALQNCSNYLLNKLNR